MTPAEQYKENDYNSLYLYTCKVVYVTVQSSKDNNSEKLC